MELGKRRQLSPPEEPEVKRPKLVVGYIAQRGRLGYTGVESVSQPVYLLLDKSTKHRTFS